MILLIIWKQNKCYFFNFIKVYFRLEEATGKTEKEYLDSIQKLIEKYNFPEELLPYMNYFDFETKTVKDYLTKAVIFK